MMISSFTFARFPAVVFGALCAVLVALLVVAPHSATAWKLVPYRFEMPAELQDATAEHSNWAPVLSGADGTTLPLPDECTPLNRTLFSRVVPMAATFRGQPMTATFNCSQGRGDSIMASFFGDADCTLPIANYRLVTEYPPSFGPLKDFFWIADPQGNPLFQTNAQYFCYNVSDSALDTARATMRAIVDGHGNL